MTNREWLNGLSDHEFAMFCCNCLLKQMSITKTVKGEAITNHYSYTFGIDSVKYSKSSSVDAVETWLNQKYTDDIQCNEE